MTYHTIYNITLKSYRLFDFIVFVSNYIITKNSVFFIVTINIYLFVDYVQDNHV